jgi:hypothetical protein
VARGHAVAEVVAEQKLQRGSADGAYIVGLALDSHTVDGPGGARRHEPGSPVDPHHARHARSVRVAPVAPAQSRDINPHPPGRIKNGSPVGHFHRLVVYVYRWHVLEEEKTAFHAELAEKRREKILIFQAVHYSLDPFAQSLNVKVNQQSNLHPRELEVRQELPAMYSLYALDRLEFNDHCPLNQQIEAISAVQGNTFVDYRLWHLPLNSQPELCQFMHHARLVSGFQQSWT